MSFMGNNQRQMSAVKFYPMLVARRKPKPQKVVHTHEASTNAKASRKGGRPGQAMAKIENNKTKSAPDKKKSNNANTNWYMVILLRKESTSFSILGRFVNFQIGKIFRRRRIRSRKI